MEVQRSPVFLLASFPKFLKVFTVCVTLALCTKIFPMVYYLLLSMDNRTFSLSFAFDVSKCSVWLERRGPGTNKANRENNNKKQKSCKKKRKIKLYIFICLNYAFKSTNSSFSFSSLCLVGCNNKKIKKKKQN